MTSLRDIGQVTGSWICKPHADGLRKEITIEA